MLAQFQKRYPQASLLSQLLTIYQGKFIVQVSVQIEGVICGTGMAAAETIELAEDQARIRAISIIATPELTESVPQESGTSIPKSIDMSSSIDLTTSEGDNSTDAPPENYPEFPAKNDLALTDFNSAIDADFGYELITPTSLNSVPTLTNVTPFVSHPATEDLPLIDPLTVTEPVDLSDTLIAIETELRNLRWTAEQERKYIKRIYNKESRDLLSTQQLYEFLNYLQVFAQTSKELERLGWTNQQGKEYLVGNYQKQSRQYLSYQELKEFLQHLEAMN